MDIKDYFLGKIGITEGMHILMHSSMREIRKAFPGLTAENLISSLQEIITANGSLIMPAFTYCFFEKEKNEIFNPLTSPSKVGIVSELFRQKTDVVRTSSPTHSFALWGKVTDFIDENNNPTSPLGKRSIPDWLAKSQDSYVLGLGTDFGSFTFGHFLETLAPVPWHDTFCWKYLKVKPVGRSVSGKTKLIQVPGCSKSFVNFESHLKSKKILEPLPKPMYRGYFLSVETIIKEGLAYFKKRAYNLLCPMGTCQACDERWFAHLDEINTMIKSK